MIVSLCWVPKGSAKAVPEKHTVEDEDDAVVEGQDGEGEKGGAERAAARAARAAAEMEADDIDKAYNLKDYDEEGGGVFGIMDTTYYPSNKLDPHITLQGAEDMEEELEDLRILDSDALLLAATTDSDLSHLAFYVYEEEIDNSYVHHDILIGAYPLCLAWMDINPKTPATKGNFIAVGTFDPGIEIFDLDVVDALEPIATLGGPTDGPMSKDPRKLRRLQQRGPRLKKGSHTAGVMSLSWNKFHRNLLASGGADNVLKLWDVTTQQCMHTYTHHKDKVQVVEWHPTEGNILLSGAHDQQITVFDASNPTAVARWTVEAEVENVRWNPHNPKEFFASLDNGKVICYTVDAPGKPVWTLEAHSKATSITINPAIPNFLATVSMDKSLKLWDITDHRPSCIHSQELSVGKLFCGSFYASSPYILALGGKKGIKFLNTLEFDAVKEIFGPKGDATDSTTDTMTTTASDGEKGKEKMN